MITSEKALNATCWGCFIGTILAFVFVYEKAKQEQAMLDALPLQTQIEVGTYLRSLDVCQVGDIARVTDEKGSTKTYVVSDQRVGSVTLKPLAGGENVVLRTSTKGAVEFCLKSACHFVKRDADGGPPIAALSGKGP